MISNPSNICFCLALWLASILSASASAQPPADDAGAADTAPAAAAPAEGIDVAPPALETNPAVRAALELPREKPADYFQAVSWLIDLGRPELAKPILDELTKLQLTDAQRAALVGEFGSRSMLQLARAKELAPAGAQFSDACMAAATAAAIDPQRIAALVAQLTDPSAEVRELARNDLAATGQAGVTATLEALARETNPARRAALATAAAQMYPLVVGPLLAMLDTSDLALRTEVGRMLQVLNVSQGLPLLSQGDPSAERALAEAIENYKRGTPPFVPDELNQVELWSWNDATKKLASNRYPADEARIIWISRLASALAQQRPENRAYLRQALVLELEAADLDPATRPSPPIDRLASADTQLLNDVLADALEANFARAAAAVADALGKRGDVGVLYTAKAKPSPLAAALVHPNRRVRFAALRAIMTLDPSSPYPGSSRVPEALAWFAGSEGTRQAIVAMPTLAAATNLAGMLAADDLEAQATNRGRDAVDTALDMADLEMIFVDMNIIVPGIRQVLYELRISPTTGEVPIALMSAEGRFEAAQRLAAEHQRVIAVSRPHSAEVLARYVEELAKLAGRDAVPADERAAQAEQARNWLDTLRSGRRPFYTIRHTAQLTPLESRQETERPAPALQPQP